jgi:hypothetical protein
MAAWLGFAADLEGDGRSFAWPGARVRWRTDGDELVAA